MATEGGDEYAFSNCFWSKDDSGVQALFHRMHEAKSTCDEISQFFKERIAIEEEYAKKMLALSKRGLGSAELGTLKDALEVIRRSTETMGRSHANAATEIKSQLNAPLETFSASLRQRRKVVQNTAEKLYKAKAAGEVAVEKASEKYKVDCNKINGYYAQQNLLMGKDLEKNNMKLDRAHNSVDYTKREYQNALRNYADSVDRWNKEWRQSCDQFQDLEEERINFVKSNLWAYTNIVSTVCVSDDEGCENIRVALEKCDVQQDIAAFVSVRSTGNEIEQPPEFVNYLDGYGDENDGKSAYTVANFTRESHYDSSASPIAATALTTDNVVIEPQQSHPQMMQEPPQQQQQHSEPVVASQPQGPYYNGNNSSSQFKLETVSPRITAPPLVIEPEKPLNTSQRSDRSHDVRQPPPPKSRVPIPQFNVQSAGDYESIPVLAHPESVSTTAQSSPVQGSTSPNSSVYSNNTSMSSVSETPLEEEPKRRTWASPFRRRSKKDLNKGWNKDTKQPTITAKDKDYIKQQQQKESNRRSMPTSSVLNMGENMFDLGISGSQGTTSRSPFDTRARSTSPTKTMARDDPLVMALQKLKTDDVSPPQEEQPPQSLPIAKKNEPGRYNSIGDGTERSTRRIISRSAPTSPSRGSPKGMFGRSNSALVPPEPAFTATEMESTSHRYAAQTKEMFGDMHIDDDPRQVQQRRGGSSNMNMQRPRSQNELRGSIHQQGPPPQQQHFNTMRERSKTMYYESPEEQQQSQQSQYGDSVRGHRRTKSASPIKQGYQNPAEQYRRAASPGLQQAYNPPQQAFTASHMSPRPQDPYMRSTSPNASRQSIYQDTYRGEMHETYRREPTPQDYQPQQTSRANSPMYRRATSPKPQLSSRQSYYDYSDVHDAQQYYDEYEMQQSVRQPPRRNSVDARQSMKGQPQATLPTISSDGRRIIRYGKAAYDYRAAIPEEVSFRKGDMLLVLRMQEDGWWEVEVYGSRGRFGLAPSNFLINI
ncbi:hypothetical protein TRVA0_025S00782 [Trichomonascus vanleenenianus]|uniref:formin-binding protein HOF1 n=1 Tax=Trichomonascus vanleenenianus TaxID=2268995 RepID=UPI003EC98BB7